jgi:hypothetical protein
MNISKNLLFVIISSVVSTATILPSQQKTQCSYQRGTARANSNYGRFTSYNTPRGMMEVYTTPEGKVYPVYNNIVISSPEIAEQEYPKQSDRAPVKFTVKNGAYCSSGQNDQRTQ